MFFLFGFNCLEKQMHDLYGNVKGGIPTPKKLIPCYRCCSDRGIICFRKLFYSSAAAEYFSQWDEFLFLTMIFSLIFGKIKKNEYVVTEEWSSAETGKFLLQWIKFLDDE
jgi:hypothetical protein